MPVLGSLPLDLKGQLDAILAKARGPVALACVDQVTGAAWALEGDRSFPAGQLSALSLLMQAFERGQGDAFDLEGQRRLLLRAVAECDGTAIAQLAEKLDWPQAETVTARGLLESLATLEDGHPLWELLSWEGDRTKFPRRLPHVPMAYKAADRCEPQLAHAAGRLGGPEGVLLVILSEGDPTANSLVGRIAKLVWEHRQAQLERQHAASERLDALRAKHLPDRRLGLYDVQVSWKDGALHVTGETTLPETVFSTVGLPSAVVTLHGEPARVTAPVLNLRREPRHGSELVSQAPLGTPLGVLQRPEGEWWRVQTPDGYVAWARSANLRPELAGEEGLRTLPVVLMAAREDGMGHIPLAAGSELRILARREEGWLAETPLGVRVRIPETEAIAAVDRPERWRHPADLGAQALALAERWLGIPYLWGGKSGWGLDCSGLTQLSYELLGIRLPRDADQQAKALPEVPHWQDLAPGDLLFYPGHVAMWAGAGAVIHASSPQGSVVREAVSLSPWLQERCTGMARPVGPV
jgi:hypothetical protein